VPAAVGVALGRPGTRIIAVLGDGASMSAIQALWSAAEHRLPISFVIVNNRRYAALVEFGRVFGLQRVVGTDLPNIDYAGIAAAQGLGAERVEDAEALDEALRRSFATEGPTLVEVCVG
jgi:benzoylformate decarboxylase